MTDEQMRAWNDFCLEDPVWTESIGFCKAYPDVSDEGGRDWSIIDGMLDRAKNRRTVAQSN